MATMAQRQYLEDFEDEVRPQLDDVSLVGEIEYPLETAEHVWNIHVVEHLKAARDGSRAVAERFTQRYRVSLVAAIVAISRHYYEKGALWPVLEERLAAMGIHRGLDQTTQNVFRHVFIETLREHGLTVVGGEHENHMVHTAAMHAGIPTYCLDDWFNLTERGRQRVSDDSSALTRWAILNIDKAIMQDIDQPIKRMLTTSFEFSEDLFERAIELVDYLRSQTESSDLERLGQASADEIADQPAGIRAREIGLHPRWVQMASRNMTRTGNGNRQRQAKTQVAQPSFRLNAAEGQVELLLPPVMGVAADVIWGVDQGSGIQDHRAKAIVGEDTAGTTTLSVPITNARASVGVTVAGKRTEAVLWPVGSPLMAFKESGQQLATTSGRIPAGPLWLLLPSDGEWSRNGEPGVPLAEDDSPLGWSSWRLVQLVVETGDVLRFSGPSFTEPLELTASGKVGPRIDLPNRVTGVSSHGLPVVAQHPTVTLPKGTTSWQISVTPFGATNSTWATSAVGGQTVEVLRGHEPTASTYELRVRGPLGRGAVERFVLVDGLQVVASPPVRRLDGAGRLAATNVTIGAAAGVRLSNTSLSLDSDTRHATVTAIGQRGETARLRLSIPATLTAAAAPGEPIRWGPRPASVSVDDLANGVVLHLRLPDHTENPVVVASSQGVALQTLQGTGAKGSYRIQLDALRDLSATKPQLDLHLQDGQRVGQIRRSRTVRGVTYAEPGELLLEGVDADLPGLEAWVWPAGASWRAGVCVTADESGDFRLPDHLVDAHDLLVHTRVVDDWVEEPDPGGDAPRTLVPAPGTLQLSPNEQRIREVAVDARDSLSDEDVDTAVDILLNRYYQRGWPPQATDNLQTALLPHAATTILNLAHRNLSPRELLWALLRTGVYSQKVSLTAQQTGELWLLSPFLAAVFAAESLPTDDLTEGSGQQWLTTAVAEFGETYADMLATGHDQFSAEGRFDLMAIQLEEHPVQLELVVRSLGLAPKRLLDRDSRTQRVIEIARWAQSTEVSRFPIRLSHQVQAITRALAKSGHAGDAAEIEAVMPDGQGLDHHWLPASVRAMAILSRHGQLRWTPTPEDRKVMAKAAEVAPELCLAELVRASALLREADQGGIAAA